MASPVLQSVIHLCAFEVSGLGATAWEAAMPFLGEETASASLAPGGGSEPQGCRSEAQWAQGGLARLPRQHPISDLKPPCRDALLTQPLPGPRPCQRLTHPPGLSRQEGGAGLSLMPPAGGCHLCKSLPSRCSSPGCARGPPKSGRFSEVESAFPVPREPGCRAAGRQPRRVGQSLWCP